MSPYRQAYAGAAAKAGTGALAHLATSLGLVIAAATLIMAVFAGRRLIASLRQHRGGGAHRRAMIRPAVVFGSLVLAAAAASGTAAYLRAHPEMVTVTRLVRVPGQTVSAVSARQSATRSPRPSLVPASVIGTAARSDGGPAGGHQAGTVMISLPSQSASAMVSLPPATRDPGARPSRPRPSRPRPSRPRPSGHRARRRRHQRRACRQPRQRPPSRPRRRATSPPPGRFP